MNEVEQAEVSVQSQVFNFEFKGKGGEYFKIWTVNILLSIITLGIYSAWAKVRRKRYFYGSVRLDGSGFEYTADPKKILKGRLIVFTMYFLWLVISSAIPAIGTLIFIVFSFIMPVIINRALRFNAYNSSYRNVRFGYAAEYWETFINFIVFGFLSGITAGLLYPLYIHVMKKHIIEHSRFGTKQFGYSGKVGDMYIIFLKTIGVALLLVAFVFAVGFIIGFVGLMPVYAGGQFVMTLSIILSIPIVLGYLRASQFNYVFSNVSISGCELKSYMQPKKYVWISVTNYIATILTIGSFIPFAVVRTMKYRYEHMKFFVRGDMGGFVAAETENIGAFGEEFDDFFDIDFGL
ncbi:MAG: YjgN family protein [Deferribacterales bacterium]